MMASDRYDELAAARKMNQKMDETTYICASCGEEIVIPVDPTQGAHQEYVEDCPICCCPMVIRIEIDADGNVQCDACRE